MSSQKLQNVAIVGAGGQVGKPTLQALLDTKRFNITVVTRESSSTKFPSDSSITVKSANYDSHDSIVSALKDNEALILMLNFEAMGQVQLQIIDAAADAGVKWILPTEFGADSANQGLVDMVPINAMRTEPRKRIEEAAKTHPGLSWIGVVNNPWFEYSLKGGFFGIDFKNKAATFYDEGTTRFNTTLIGTVGLAVARLLSLPIEATSGPSLSKYANKFIYISSFHTTQREILEAVQKATNTTDSDWTVKKASAQAWIDEGNEKVAKGDFSGMINLLYGAVMKEGLGGDFEATRGTSNEVLGLPKEDMVEVIKKIVEA
ncbi:hypothetical protein EPUS_00172 [Endocarpon pusillum Z07020]|uniref:NmrA-like domain-containing protein n=1 Tax=Endocarpon pusillum (strain Z07020 / HMAS-L-300199) TaxID=1263415 RepID=U1I0I1_ENDPU|nr:uncharacterized protein EPUS_00172 [Endocarpon pusillum Z07020]ERF75379.1 hypothetical protein EPUS_00172 [Endocarpon pusillum Z07020]